MCNSYEFRDDISYDNIYSKYNDYADNSRRIFNVLEVAPVIAGECGINSQDDYEFNTNLFQLLQDYGGSGWQVWSWDTNTTWNIDIGGDSQTNWETLNAKGEWFQDNIWVSGEYPYTIPRPLRLSTISGMKLF